jgi:putative FmdB family regulatory protein
MPIYLYECHSCGVRFERMQRISDDPLTDCPECDGHVHRIIQPVGVIFKGSGFYVTDNRRGSSSTLTPPKEHDKGEEKKTPSAGEPKVEPAAPKDTASNGD